MKINNAEDVYFYFKEKLKFKDKEHFYALFLDMKNDILCEVLISIDALNSTIIYPIDIFKPAIKASAYSIILVHNHPSGNPTPCIEDIEITKLLRRIGEIIGIRVLDHIIIGNECFVSI